MVQLLNPNQEEDLVYNDEIEWTDDCSGSSFSRHSGNIHWRNELSRILYGTYEVVYLVMHHTVLYNDNLAIR